MDILLDSDGDIDITDNSASLVTEYEAIAQHLKIRLRTFLGEWFLDTRVGIPYYQEFLIKRPNKLVMDTRLREAILETPGITDLGPLEYSFDGANRTLAISFQATLDSGTDFNFTFNDLIIGN